SRASCYVYEPKSTRYSGFVVAAELTEHLSHLTPLITVPSAVKTARTAALPARWRRHDFAPRAARTRRVRTSPVHSRAAGKPRMSQGAVPRDRRLPRADPRGPASPASCGRGALLGRIRT